MRPRRLSDGTMQAGTPRDRPRGAGGSLVRAAVRLGDDGGNVRRFATWAEVAEWIASPRFTEDSAAISSVRLVNLRREPSEEPPLSRGRKRR